VCVTRPLGSLFFGNAQSFRAEFRALIHRENPAEADALDEDFSEVTGNHLQGGLCVECRF
jgi:hypothetical protein